MREPRAAVELADVERRAVACPSSYEVPPREERESLLPGDLVKVVVVAVGDAARGERIWVRVVSQQDGRLRYRGTVVSFPVTRGLCSGDELDFGPEHVSDVLRVSGAVPGEGVN